MADSELDGWEWRVRVEEPDGKDGEWSEARALSFSPCRLEDGEACFALDPLTTEPRTPADGAVITQNDPGIDCPPHETAGFGYALAFDWLDASPPGEVAGYDLLVQRQDATEPLIHELVTESKFETAACNEFVTDPEAEDWEWKVRVKGTDGSYGAWSEARGFSFSPCRLEDGEACYALDPLTVELLTPAEGAVLPQNDPDIGCPYNETAGYGFEVDFDWVDAWPPPSGYDLVVQGANAQFAAIDTVTDSASEYEWRSCESFVGTMDWAWKVRVHGAQQWFEGTFSFAPCQLENGQSCHARR